MRGRLVKRKDAYGTYVLKLESADGESVGPQVKSRELSFEYSGVADLFTLDGTEVEFVKGKKGSREIYPVGGAFSRADPSLSPSTVAQAGEPLLGTQVPPVATPPTDRFRNPYNFVPSPTRLSHGELGDSDARTLDRYEHDLWSGKIVLNVQTVTPLLNIDGARPSQHAGDDKHLVYDVRTRQDGSPLVAATSVKGMLRAAYETVTNSRYGVFDNQKKLARRRPAQGIDLVPVRIESRNGALAALLLPGFETLTEQGEPLRDRGISGAFAAWIPAYPPNRDMASAFTHGSAASAFVCRYLHVDRRYPDQKFFVERVLQIWATTAPAPIVPQAPKEIENLTAVDGVVRQVDGWVYRSNRNIKGKHDEKLFFSPGSTESVALGDDHRKQWAALIADYRDIHEKEVEKRRADGVDPAAYIGDGQPGNSGWSRHVYEDSWKELHPGMLCYAQVSGGAGSRVVKALFPVQLSRELNDLAPVDLLHPSLRPAILARQLSPADRVFGWVSEGNDTKSGAPSAARRGHIRMTEPTGLLDSDIERFPEQNLAGSLPLTILGEPKPAQALFYTGGAGKRGGSAAKVVNRPYSDKQSQGLRGRKVYPHQTVTAFSATKPVGEFVRQGLVRDSQNKSIRGWIRAGAEFSVTIWVENLSAVELGALLWLCQMPDGCYHKLGGGKPLGFGSVRLTRSDVSVCNGHARREAYLNFGAAEAAPNECVDDLIGRYKSAVKATDLSAQAFEKAPFIAGFLQAAKGYDDTVPTHYPREGATREVEGNNYVWFVRNSHRDNQNPLPNIVDDPGLRFLEKPGKKQRR